MWIKNLLNLQNLRETLLLGELHEKTFELLWLNDHTKLSN